MPGRPRYLDGTPHAEERAAVILALIVEFQMMRQSIGLTALSKADPDTLAKLLAPVFAQLTEA